MKEHNEHLQASALEIGQAVEQLKENAAKIRRRISAQRPKAKELRDDLHVLKNEGEKLAKELVATYEAGQPVPILIPVRATAALRASLKKNKLPDFLRTALQKSSN